MEVLKIVLIFVAFYILGKFLASFLISAIITEIRVTFPLTIRLNRVGAVKDFKVILIANFIVSFICLVVLFASIFLIVIYVSSYALVAYILGAILPLWQSRNMYNINRENYDEYVKNNSTHLNKVRLLYLDAIGKLDDVIIKKS